MNQKGFSAVASIIIVGVLVFAGAFGVRYFIKEKPQPIVQSNLFDLDTIKVGDTVVGMKVVSIKPVHENLPISLTKGGESNLAIQFSGELTVSGTYKYIDEPILCNRFELDEVSKNKLPQVNLRSYPRENSLCIFIQDPKLDFKRGGQATVVVNDLTFHYWPGWPSEARIVKVIEDQPKY